MLDDSPGQGSARELSHYSRISQQHPPIRYRGEGKLNR